MLLKYADKCVECRTCGSGSSPLFHIHSMNKNTDISNINQSDSVFMYVSNGSIELTAGQFMSEILTNGMMLFIPANVDFGARTLSYSNMVTCAFSREMLLCSKYIMKEIESGLSSASARMAYRVLYAKSHIVRFFEFLVDVLGMGLGCPCFHDLKRKELVMLLMTLYTKEELYYLIYPPAGHKDRFKDFILRNYMDVPDVKSFASKANMSTSTFQRWFKGEFGMQPGEWMKERKAELVLREIKDTDKGFAVIAEEFGFSSGSHLGTFCKHHFGMLPSQIRARKQDTEAGR